MKYEYWCPGQDKPAVVPDGCEAYDPDFGKWLKDNAIPATWSRWSRRWPVAEVEVKPVIEYVYWNPGDRKPSKLPDGCEYGTDAIGWTAEWKSNPLDWGSLPRRWPKPVIEYVYWRRGDARPATLPEGCEYKLPSGWRKETCTPGGWTHADRRWPKPAAKPEAALAPVPERIDSWDEYFYKMAELGKLKSKDRSTQCCSVIVGPANNVLSIGFNGFPRGVDDNVESRHERPEKYLYTEHGERNAFYNAAMHGIKIGGARMYLSGGGLPCADCARAVIQCGIVEIIVMDQPFQGKGGLWEASMKASEIMLKEAGVKVTLLDQNFKRKN